MTILEIFTFPEKGGYKGGVATMVEAYMNATSIFADHGMELSLMNCPSRIHTPKSSVNNLLYIFTQRRALCKLLRERSFDVVHIHTSREFLFLKDVLLMKLIARRFRLPVVMTIHVGALETVYNRIGWFKNRSLAIINRYASKIVFLSSVMRDDFVRAGLREDKQTVLYNFHTIPSDAQKKESHEGMKMLYVGAIHREKGMCELLNAMDALRDHNIHLDVCGLVTDSSIAAYVEDIQQKLGDKISMLGYVAGEEKTEVFRNADVLVLPSYHEGLPLVIMEALGAGCAILTTPVGAIPEVLDESNAIMIPPADEAALCNAINALYYDFEKRCQMQETNGAKGRKYSLETHLETLCTIYKEVKK